MSNSRSCRRPGEGRDASFKHARDGRRTWTPAFAGATEMSVVPAKAGIQCGSLYDKFV